MAALRLLVITSAMGTRIAAMALDNSAVYTTMLCIGGLNKDEIMFVSVVHMDEEDFVFINMHCVDSVFV